MFNSSGAVIPRVCLFPRPHSSPSPSLSGPSAPTSGNATSENGRNNTAFVHHSALGLPLNKCSEEEFWWLALPLGPGWSQSDFINTLWSNQKNKSPFIKSYMVMELFPHQLKFTFLSPCPHVDYLFYSCSKKGNVLLPRAQTCISAELHALQGVEWWGHDSQVYATFSACIWCWCCGNIYRVVNTHHWPKLLVFMVFGVRSFLFFLFSFLRGD